MTSLIRFSPSTEMRRLQREIDRVFDGFFPSSGNDREGNAAVWTPRVDVAETENAYVIHLDVPGMSKEELEINYRDGALMVSGERKMETKEEQQSFVRVERAFGQFYRAFTLPQAVNQDDIEATYADGVLTVRVPKAEESMPRRIQIS